MKFSEYQYLQEKLLTMESFREKDRMANVVWKVLQSQYWYMGGFRGWNSADEMAKGQNILFAIEFEGENIQEITQETIYCVGVYKKKFGNKMVGFASNTRYLKDDLHKNLKQKMGEFIRERLGNYDWIESSGKMLSFIAKNSGGGKLIKNIHPENLIKYGIKGIDENSFKEVEVYGMKYVSYDRLLHFNNKKSTEVAWGIIKPS